tara:strand:- start:218 stop:598 length:381 start_codon:yes stop_codon:yes gene_type:complete
MIKRFFSTKTTINITNNAWNKINDILKNSKNHKMIFSAVSGGCNGLNYNLELVDDNSFNKMFGNQKIPIINNKIHIDPLSEMYLLGTTVDYVTEDYNNGIFENKFTFTPNKDLYMNCGCGKSFSPK